MANWKNFKSWLFGPRAAPQSSEALDAPGARDVAKSLLALELTTAGQRTANEPAVKACLDKYEKEANKLASKAAGYPDRPITADVLMDGMELVGIGEALTRHFGKAGWVEREEDAAYLWSKAALAIYSHQHHMVGPAMLARGDCAERLGAFNKAAQVYNAIIGDFSWIVEATETAPSLSRNDLTVLSSLAAAIRRSLTLEKDSTIYADRRLLLRRAEDILARGG
jgi:hypothetical protein